MLELKANCETCTKSLPPFEAGAFICSFECTYCSDCSNHKHEKVCPNCGGELQPRPTRPKALC